MSTRVCIYLLRLCNCKGWKGKGQEKTVADRGRVGPFVHNLLTLCYLTRIEVGDNDTSAFIQARS